ncbi:ATP-binding protein [Jatrophihabitans sp.]|jgi:hypothetical protein|uniref:ATP-binding protein n=1 Tax=Jatrophihabitans sp. TaxID=1932789 RepID=UPI002EFF116E
MSISEKLISEQSIPEQTIALDRPAGELIAGAARVARAIADVLLLRCPDQPAGREAAEFLYEWAKAQEQDTAAVEPTDAQLSRLGIRYRLTPVELDLILLAGLPEEHEGIAATLRSLHPQGEPHPSLGLAALALNRERADLGAVVGTGTAFRHGLLRLTGSGTLFERSLELAAELWPALRGWDGWPAELPRLRPASALPGLAGWLGDPAVAAAVGALAGHADVTVLVHSADETVGLSRCVLAAEQAGLAVVAGRVAAADRRGIELLCAHAAARDCLPLLAIASDQPVTLAVDGLPGPVLELAPTGTVRHPAGRAVAVLPVQPVPHSDVRTAWRQAVPELDEARLAARHPLDPALTAQIALDLREQPGPPALAGISALIRARATAGLPAGLELLRPAVAWHELVLPLDSACQLREAVARLDHQAEVLEDWQMGSRAHATRGVRLLFTGPPGTGKSLAAGAIATAARTDLLVVDVSRVVSKWLGETEKNLASAFDAAEQTQAVLLLDEADALFGSRTEISDAHDRYANLETAYLLQRLDAFGGVAVLATNLRQNIDAAFIRRMDFVVEFSLPDLASRAALWRLHLPAGTRCEDVDIEGLARLYPVPGGWVRNVAVAAAFSAAAAGDRVRPEHLSAAMRREYAKAAMPFPGEPPRRRHDQV